MQSPHRHNKPLVLIILDGWGYRTDPTHNAIVNAHTPTWDHLWENYPHSLLSASNKDVGLPAGQMGNSEVGHLHMGAGRIVMQDLNKINNSIEKKEFSSNKTLTHLLQKVRQTGSALHLIGLLSPGGVHSHIKHIEAAVSLAAQQGIERCFIHAILDGRDTPPQSAINDVQQFEHAIAPLNCGKIVSLIGRYYAMDRDKRWQRTKLAYDLFTQAQTDTQRHASSTLEALSTAYANGETDEFVKPTLIGKTPQDIKTSRIRDNDAVLFMNFRADRSRQLTRAFIYDNFEGFERTLKPRLNEFVTLTEYAKEFPVTSAFPAQPVSNNFGEYIAKQGLKQLRLAETEKYAHVTFFFNGGTEAPYPNEDRLMIPSPQVSTYDKQPEMSALELTEQLTQAITADKYDVIICNYANADMVGHTGNFKATIKAVETIDQCLAKVKVAIQAAEGELIITADHGNAELMYNDKNQHLHTAHTSEPVPCLYVGNRASAAKENGVLYDIAPTLLHLLGLKQPQEMKGTHLFQLPKAQ